MSSETPKPEVTHNENDRRFEAIVDGFTSYASYVLDGDRMIIDYTFVPPALRGKGLAERVVRATLQEARRRNLRVVPQCSYVAVFIQRHKEFQDLLSDQAG